MGQRVNYIIRSGEELTIHYHHWRANSIAKDLYAGEKKFLSFVKKCRTESKILEESWIEGCVIIDKRAKKLSFWSLELPNDTSVIQHYLSALSTKWKGWNVKHLTNRMYDVELELGINYISQQEFPTIKKLTSVEILIDKVEEWITALVIIKNGESLHIVETGDITLEGILDYGKDIIELFKLKPNCKLPLEGEEKTYQCIVIDIPTKRILVNQSLFGVWEQCMGLWEGYDFTMGDFGYLETLRIAGIDIADLTMPYNQVVEQFNSITSYQDNFDPHAFAQKLIKEEGYIEFNPYFFDDAKPELTPFDKLKAGIKKILGS